MRPFQSYRQVPTEPLQKVKFERIYDGVDVVYYGNNQQLEYDFVVAPHADPRQIKLRFEGVKAAKIEKSSGDLLLETGAGTIRQHKPFVYQQIGGEKREIASLYELENGADKSFNVSFKLAGYDRSKELIIDPILVNRPIVVTPKGAALCRPAELALGLL